MPWCETPSQASYFKLLVMGWGEHDFMAQLLVMLGTAKGLVWGEHDFMAQLLLALDTKRPASLQCSPTAVCIRLACGTLHSLLPPSLC
jgi:hypothetical protein